MSIYQDWTNKSERQTDKTFPDFWKEYCDAEEKIYSGLLEKPDEPLTGTFAELVNRFRVPDDLFMGFLDGIGESLKEPLPELETIEQDTELSISADIEKLFFNMHNAQAKHLYTLEEWDNALSEEDRERIMDEYRQSRTVRKEKLPGRNDPCPCGSGKKYKKCCGKAV